ncbi:MAG: UDP-N-acetylmuramoyl-tripeptide--D-alanyl-D-alanine ligase [Firmicutes bacterium]|jgi:UDP-N-acetylmuramoyl-tripeptide--D-alanyl-D-alanine ligase|nr:UDP-N-acetylmuramoyl-tripeptide--D-alanyl-D-alanine ligase [Bacillota bacterium]
MPVKGADLLEACRGELLQGDPEQIISGFSIDTRTIQRGDFFIPLRGEKEDGHRYLPAAAAGGASGSFCARRPPPGLPPQFLLIGVPDVLAALQQAAAFHRRRFNLPVIGVTGSSGKTTTKDFIASVLSSRMKVLKTEGNLNNEIGLPLTLLRLDQSCQVAVLEMGMSAPGEITLLAQLADPGIGVITNIGEAHLEMLGSIEAIAAAKEELLDVIGSRGTAVLNADDPRLQEIGARFGGKVYTYGFTRGDIRATSFSQRRESSYFRVSFPDGEEGSFSLPLPGRHLASNALAALTVGYLLGVSPLEMKSALQKSRITGGRLQLLTNRDGIRIIDDSYNANPDSVRAALEVLQEMAGSRSIAILGDMLELGPAEKELHREVGRFAAGCQIGALVTVGKLGAEIAAGAAAAGLPAVACPSHAAAVEAVQRMAPEAGWCILVKGSRGMRMETIVKELMDTPKGDSE